jgi:hypothetical protein
MDLFKRQETDTISRDVSKVKYQVSLDYDDWNLLNIQKELKRLKIKFPHITFTLFRSSRGHYHIRSFNLLIRNEAFRILHYSKCSMRYKRLCRKLKAFPIRIGKKTWVSYTGKVIITPAPVLIKSL